MRREDIEKVIRSVANAAANNFVFEKFPDAQIVSDSNVRLAPASVMARTDAGIVLVLDPAVLMRKSALDLRSSGLIVPVSIPDDAEVIRDAEGRLLFKWFDGKTDNPPQP